VHFGYKSRPRGHFNSPRSNTTDTAIEPMFSKYINHMTHLEEVGWIRMKVCIFGYKYIDLVGTFPPIPRRLLPAHFSFHRISQCSPSHFHDTSNQNFIWRMPVPVWQESCHLYRRDCKPVQRKCQHYLLIYALVFSSYHHLWYRTPTLLSYTTVSRKADISSPTTTAGLAHM
jgi:hypothetical protein